MRKALVAGTLTLLLAAACTIAGSRLAKAELDIAYANSFSGSYLAARAANLNSDLRAAAKFYREALQRDPEDQLLRQQTFTFLLADGDVEGALPFADHLDEEGNNSHFVSAALGAEALIAEDYDRAREVLRDTREGPLFELSTALMRAWATAGKSGVEAALADIDRLRGPDWFEPFKQYHAGLIAGFGGDLETAERRLRDAHRTENGSLWLRVAADYARVLALRGETERGLQILDEATESFGENIMLDAVADEIRSGDITYFDELTPAVGAAEVLYNIGIAVSRDGGEQLTLIYLRLALHLDDDLHIARLFLANYYERIEDYERMIDVLEQIPESSILFTESTIRVGMALNSLERFEDAKDHLAGAIDKLDHKLTAITSLGNIYRMNEDYAEAAELYSQGIDQLDLTEEDAWQLFYFRGIAYERTDQWEKAEADFRKALELRPEQPRVLNYLGYSWVDQGMNYDEALAMIERAVELRPNDGYIVDSLGWAFYKLGRYKDAVVELERAVELRPRDPTINDHLGDAYWQVGRRLEAMFQWSHARDNDPEPELLTAIEEKLAKGLVAGATDQADARDAATASESPAAAAE